MEDNVESKPLLITDFKVKSKARIYGYVFLCTLVACVGSLNQGYDVGIMSGAILYMERDLNLSDFEMQSIIGALTLASVFGSIMGGQLGNRWGRKITVMVSAVTSFFGSVLLSVTSNIWLLILARIILGIGMGACLLIAPLYTAEISPPFIRGKLVTFAEIFINVGILLGYFVAFLFKDASNDNVWRIMTFIGALPAIFVFIGMLFMPRSPRWLIEHNRVNDAMLVLNDICFNNAEAKDTLNSMIDTVKLESQTIKSSWKEILCIFNLNKGLQQSLIIGVGVAFFQQATGNEAAVYYTPKVFRQAGLSDNMVLLCTIFVGLSKVSFIFISTFSLDRVGRRPLLLTSAILVTLSIAGLAISFEFPGLSVLTLIMQSCFMASFSMGWGPILWVITSEIFPLKIRDRAMGLCTCLNRLASGAVAFTFLSMQDALTPAGVWWFYTGVSVISVLFVYFKVPETKGETLENLSQAFMMNNSNTNDTQTNGEHRNSINNNDHIKSIASNADNSNLIEGDVHIG